MPRKISLLFILPSLKRAGAETQTIDLINGLDKEKYEKHLLCFEPELDLLDRVDSESVTFHHIRRRSKLDWPLSGEIARLMDDKSIDVVFCSLMIALFWGWLGSRRARRRVPVIAALHTTINRDLKADVYDFFLYQWLLRDCNKVVFVCKAQQAHWQKRFPFLIFNSVCIHNGIDTGYFQRSAVTQSAIDDLRSKLGITEEARLVCHIAAFRPEKGQRLLLEAFISLAFEFPEVHLVLAGDGPLRTEIVEAVRRNGLEGRVHLPGALSDVRPLLALAEWSLLPSTAVETFSMAMLESLSMQVPMIASDIGGAREAITPNETGFLVEAANTDVLGTKLREVLSNNTRRTMGSQGRLVVEQSFSKSSMLEKYEAIIDEVANRNLKPSVPDNTL